MTKRIDKNHAIWSENNPLQAKMESLGKKMMILTRRSHEDKHMGETDCIPPAYGHAEAYQKNMELLRIGYLVQNHVHVLCQPVFFL